MGSNGMKNDFGGHSNHHTKNVYAYAGQAIGFYDAPMLEGYEDQFSDNRVVLTGTNVGSETCSGPGTTIMGNNQYFTSTGRVTECKTDLDKWHQQGHDKGSTVAMTPDDDTIMA